MSKKKAMPSNPNEGTNKKEITPHQNVGMNNNKPRPEIRDNLDHREHLEQQNKGAQRTHNKKEVHNAPRKGKH